MLMKRSAILMLHMAYWLTYLTLILVFVLATWHVYPGRALHDLPVIFFRSQFSLGVIYPAILSFYIFYFILFSRYLQRKLFVRLIMASLTVAILTATIFTALQPLAHKGPPLKLGEMISIGAFVAVIALIHGEVALVMRGFISWYGDIRLKKKMADKQQETELALLKSQLNPHFLFNTIHNIDVLIGKDPEKASLYLNKLSDIMRFMLYETQTGSIPLEKELTYIGKYIDLQRIRSANPEYVRYGIEGDPGTIRVEPMLFIPFIENAFKYAETRKKEDAINIHFQIDADTIIFDCENRFSMSVTPPQSAGGLGNQLIKKRLDLLYPGRHQLDIGAMEDIYKVKLILHGSLA